MKRIKLKDKVFRPFISTPQIEQATRGIAADLNNKFKNETTPVRFVVVLNGAMPFAMNLFTKLKFPVELDTVKLSSYEGTTQKEIKTDKPVSLQDYEGKKVIIVEDIIDTGNTVDYLKDYFNNLRCTDVTAVSLLIKPEVYRKKHPEFTQWGILSGVYRDDLLNGIAIGDVFVVGYGLDYDGLGRNLNKIYALES